MTTTAVPLVCNVASDDQLVAAALADPARFDLVYERHRLPVYRYLRAIGASDADALDLTAATFERALRSLSGYRARGGGLAAWLFRIARNARLDEHRRTARWVDIAEARQLVADLPDTDATTQLRIVLAALPDTAREAIALRYAGGLTAREIGLVMGKRPEATQKLIRRTLDTLREALHDDH